MHGNVLAIDSFVVSEGLLEITGEIESNGKLNVFGDLVCNSLDTDDLEVNGTVQAETEISVQSLKLSAFASAHLADTLNSTGDVVIKPAQQSSGFLSSLFGNGGGASGDAVTTAGAINCDGDIELENVHAEHVEAVNVIVRGGCDIDKITHTGTIEVDASSTVGDTTKV